jgi:hypothetical protein
MANSARQDSACVEVTCIQAHARPSSGEHQIPASAKHIICERQLLFHRLGANAAGSSVHRTDRAGDVGYRDCLLSE